MKAGCMEELLTFHPGLVLVSFSSQTVPGVVLRADVREQEGGRPQVF